MILLFSFSFQFSPPGKNQKIFNVVVFQLLFLEELFVVPVAVEHRSYCTCD
jgi:hypothetical protein